MQKLLIFVWNDLHSIFNVKDEKKSKKEKDMQKRSEM